MDPNQCLRDILDAFREGERGRALTRLTALCNWIEKGGWLPNPDYERREEASLRTALVCREYARLRCAGHQALAELDELEGAVLYGLFLHAAGHLYHGAPDDALRWLDACKRVVEIDTHVVNPDVVLARASVRGV